MDLQLLRTLGLPVWLLIATALLFILAKDPEKFYGLFFRHRMRKLEIIDKCLAQERGNSATTAQLQELRDAIAFQLVTGIYAKKTLRETLFRFHELTPNEINWFAIHQGILGASLTDKGLTFTKPDKWKVRVSIGVTVLLLMAWIATVGLGLLSILKTGAEVDQLIGAALLFLIMTTIMVVGIKVAVPPQWESLLAKQFLQLKTDYIRAESARE